MKYNVTFIFSDGFGNRHEKHLTIQGINRAEICRIASEYAETIEEDNDWDLIETKFEKI